MRVSILGPELELTPVGAERFAFDRTDATLTFEVDPEGRTTGLVMGLGGVDYPAARVQPPAN